MKSEIAAARNASPFVPFEIQLVGGRVLRVPHPEFVYVPPGKAHYFIVTHPDGTPETCNATMALSIRPTPPSRGRRPPRRRAG